MASETLSHYRILHKLGSGGMGEVYLAEDTRLDRKVAIKFLPSNSTSDQQAKKRLIREAQAAAKLDHSNTCSIYEVGEEEGRSFIVMQYAEGETLSSSDLLIDLGNLKRDSEAGADTEATARNHLSLPYPCSARLGAVGLG